MVNSGGRLLNLGLRVGRALDAVPGVSASALGNYAMVGGQVLRTLIMARLLGVHQFGVLNLANVSANFTALADVGTSVIGNQKASEARGGGRLEEGLRLQTDAGSARMFPSLVIGALVAVAAVILWASGRTDLAVAAGFVAVSAPLQGGWFAVREYLRVSGQFVLATRAQINQVAVWLTAVPLATWAWGLTGAFVTISGSFLAPVLAARRHVPLRQLMIPRWGPFHRWLRLGLPIWLGLVTSFLYTNIDQFVMGAVLGPGAVGIYAIGLLVSTALVAFTDGAAAAAHPQTLENAARLGKLDLATLSIWKTMRISQAVLGIMVPLSWLALVLLTATVLPAYESALPLVTLLGPASAAVGVATASNSALLATGRHRLVPLIFLLATVSKTALVLLALALWPSVMTFAVTAFIGSLVFLVTYLATLAKALDVHRPLAWLAFHLVSPMALAIFGYLVILAMRSWGPTGYAGASTLAIVGSFLLHALLWRAYSPVVTRAAGTNRTAE